MARELRERIEKGPLRPGARLPTEKELAEEFGVSRTVVREAVAALRADGLVEPRQGSGVFVTAPRQAVIHASPLPAAFAPSDPAGALDLLELRVAVETQSAAVAAVRRSWAQEARIREHLHAMREAIDAGEPTEAADFAFHRAIAEATNNKAIVAFLDLIHSSALPRHLLRAPQSASLISKAYLDKVYQEHCAIVDAIGAGDGEAARRAMQTHLAGSQNRYRALLDSYRDAQGKSAPVD